MITEEMIENLKLTNIEESTEKEMLLDRVKDMMATMVIGEKGAPMIARGPVDGIPIQRGNSFLDFQPPNKFSKPFQHSTNLYSVDLIESLRETPTEICSNISQFNFENNQIPTFSQTSVDFIFDSHNNEALVPHYHEPCCMQKSFPQCSNTSQLNFHQGTLATPNYNYNSNKIQNKFFVCSSFMAPNSEFAFQTLHSTNNVKLTEPFQQTGNHVVNETVSKKVDTKIQNHLTHDPLVHFPTSKKFTTEAKLTDKHERSVTLNNLDYDKLMNDTNLQSSFYELEKNIDFLNTNLNGDEGTQVNKCNEKILISNFTQDSNYVDNEKNNEIINSFNNFFKYKNSLKHTTEKESAKSLLMNKNNDENILSCSIGNYDDGKDEEEKRHFDESVMKKLLDDFDKEYPSHVSSFLNDDQVLTDYEDLYDILNRTTDENTGNDVVDNSLLGSKDSLNKEEESLSEVIPQSISTLSSAEDLLMYVQPSKYQDLSISSLTNGTCIKQADFYSNESLFNYCENYEKTTNSIALQQYSQQPQQQFNTQYHQQKPPQQTKNFLPELEINDEDFGFNVLENLMLLSEQNNKKTRPKEQANVKEIQNNYESINKNQPATNIKQNDFFIANNLEHFNNRFNPKSLQRYLTLQQIALADDAGDNLLHQAIIHEDVGLFMSIMRALDMNANKNNVSNQLVESILNSKNHHYQSPMILAVLQNKPLMLRHLLNKNVNPNQKIVKKIKNSEDQKTCVEFLFPVHMAASRGKKWLLCLKELLSCPIIQPDLCDSNGVTALHLGVLKHHRRVSGVAGIVDNTQSIEALVSVGADILKSDLKSGMNAFHISIITCSFDISHLLLKLTLQKSLEKSHKRIVSKLVSVKTGNGNTALHLAASLKLHKKQPFFKPDPPYQNHFQHTQSNYNYFYNGIPTPLNHPVLTMRNQEEKMKNNLMMEQMMDEKKENLIREKKVEEQIELIQVLLKNGADPSCKNSEGFISRELTSNSSIVNILKGKSSTRKFY